MVNLSECVKAFKSRKINGQELLNLNEEKLWLWAGDLKIRQRIQISKYLNECRNRDSDAPGGLKATFKSKIRKSPVPPPVPQPDYTAGSVSDADSYEDDGGWDTDFDDEFEDEAEADAEVERPVENGVYSDTENRESLIINNNNNNEHASPLTNGKLQVAELVRRLESQPATQQPEVENETPAIEPSHNSSATSCRAKPDVPKRKPALARPSSTTSLNKATKPRPTSFIARPQQMPPPPPTAPKPLASSMPDVVPCESVSECECPSPQPSQLEDSDDGNACDNYEIPTSSLSNANERGLASMSSNVAASTISLISSSSRTQGNSRSPSQLELNQEFMDDADYEIPDGESQWSGSSSVSMRSTSSDRPALPPKFRPQDANIPPPLPEKPANRRPLDPPQLPSRDRPHVGKKQTDEASQKSSITNNCKQKLSSLLNTFGTKMSPDKRANSAMRVDKLSPDRECIPTLEAAFEMTKSSSMSSLRPSAEITASIVNMRPLPPVPGNKPVTHERLLGNSFSPDDFSKLSQSPKTGIYLETFPWFHKVEREEAEELLRSSNENECYLVRESRRGGECNPFTLSLYFEGKLSHLNIRRRPDGKFALGREKENEQTFNTIEELITHHQREPILLTAKGQPLGKVILSHCCDKQRQ